MPNSTGINLLNILLKDLKEFVELLGDIDDE